MKKMNRILAISLLFCMAFTSIFAQGPGKPSKEEMKEKISALKVSYFTDRLDLSSTEAQQFWPIYNEFEDEMDALRPSNPGEPKPNIDELSDQEIENKINEMFAKEYKKLQLEEVYFDKFKAVIPLQKILKLYKAEKDFKKEMINQFKERKQNQN